MILKEFIVTLKNREELDGFYAEMEAPGLFEFIPDREVVCVKRRPISRNTHYLLTLEEAEKLKQDPRVESVSLNYVELGLEVIPHATQTANFNRSSTMEVGHVNWGLYRSSNSTNDAGWSDIGGNANKNATIDLPVTGDGVDVIVVDEIMYPDHSEFGNRAQQYDWFANYDDQVRGTGCEIVRVERASNIARITTRSAHGLQAGNRVTVICNSNGSFNVTNGSVIDVSATPIGTGGDGVTVNRFRYANTGLTVNLTSVAVSSVSRTNNQATVICSTAHGLTNGDTIGINISTNGFSSFAAAGVSVTVLNATTFRYNNTGGDVSTTTVTGNVFLDDAVGSWSGNYIYENYSSGNNHATVVGGIIGGETQGWARGANLYNLRHDYNSLPANNFVPLDYVFDYIRYWHADKPVNPATGRKNPTLVNCSWGVGVNTSAKNYYTGNIRTRIGEINYRGTRIRPEDLGNPKIDTGFTGVCDANTVYGELKGTQTGSTTASVTINSISGQLGGSGIVPKSSLTGTINVGDYMNTNVVNWPLNARVTSVSETETEYIISFTFLKNTNITGTSTATCTFFNSVLENVAYRIVSTGSTTTTITPITLSLGGNTGMTDQGDPDAVSSSGVDIYDDSGWACLLPFDITYLGADYGPSFGGATLGDSGYINVSTNSFVVFGGGLTLTYNFQPDPTGPGVRKICISSGDRSARKCYTQTTGTAGSRVFRIRFEGHESANGGNANNPNMIWEMRFFEATPNTIELHIGSNAVYKGEFEQNQLLTYGVDLNSISAPQRNAAIDSDIDDCIQDGIIFVGSAGNQNYKIDVPGGLDYNNYYDINGIPYYYHRGSSPGSNANVICVGSLNSSSLENKSQESNTGPRVDLYAPGVNIASSVYNNLGPGINGTLGAVRDNTDVLSISTVERAGGTTDRSTITTTTPHGLTTGDVVTVTDCSISSFDIFMAPITVTGPNSFYYIQDLATVASTSATGTVLPGYWYQKYSGTSIAAAQVSGVLALALEEYPGMSQAEAKLYITKYAKENVMFDSEGGYTDTSSLQGGPNKILFYYRERQSTGSVFPKINYRVRPDTGAVYPRTRIRRT